MPTPDDPGVSPEKFKIEGDRPETLDQMLDMMFRVLGGGGPFSPVYIDDVLSQIAEAKEHADVKVPALYRRPL